MVAARFKNNTSLELFPFQKEAVDFVISKKRCLLKIDTGLGKTAIALKAAQKLYQLGKVKSVAVVAPAFAIPTWEKECAMWLPTYDRPAMGYVSYTSFARLESVLIAQKPEMIIVDESQKLRNWTANWTQRICLHVSPKIPYAVFMSATPYVKGATDLHPTFSAIEPGRWGKYGDFADKYSYGEPDPWKRGRKKYKGLKNAELLAHNARRFTLTIDKEDVEDQLPSKRVQDIYISCDIMGASEEAEDALAYADEVPESLSRELRQLGESKVPQIVEWVKHRMTYEREPFIVFAKHQSVVQLLARDLEQALKTKSIFIHGGVNIGVRKRRLNEWRAYPNRPLVLSIGAAGVNLTLTEARLLLFAELPWSYTELKQASDRIHRIGQERDCLIGKFIAENTLDEVVNGVIMRKAHEASQLGMMN
jgi:hypothetical protein